MDVASRVTKCCTEEMVHLVENFFVAEQNPTVKFALLLLITI